MASFEEQLALFEKEVLSAVGSDEKKPTTKSEAPIQAPEIGGSTSTTTTTTATKFVPHQLQQRTTHPQAAPMAGGGRFMPSSFSSLPASAQPPSSAVIESGPALYAPPPSSSGTKQSRSSEQQQQSQGGACPSAAASSSNSMMNQQQSFKTLALPSDVELLLAKKQATKAHENSYLGAVLRGEKKMKRFVRSCGGQVWEDPSMAEWDPNDYRIFCGDLGNEVSDELLAKAFRKYSSFQKAKVCRDSRTNKSKGFGFVSFRSQEDFIRAMKEMDGKYVGNRPIKLRKSNWKDRNADVVKKKNKEKKKLGLL